MSARQDDEIELGRRVDERFGVEIDAEVTSGEGTFTAITKDVSRGGACFVVAVPMAVGSGFDLALSLVLGANSFSEPLRLAGKVVWCTQTEEGFQIGAAFVPMSADTREYLQMFLNFLAKGVGVGEDGEASEEEEDESEAEKKGLFA
jgi:PilZ domain